MSTTAVSHLFLKHQDIEAIQPFVKNEIYEEEIGDGNLNDVTRVSSKTEDGRISLILKKSLPYIKCLGEKFPLGVERMDIEYGALCKFDKLAPGSVPRPYFYEKAANTVCMEDLRGYEILRKRLMRGEFNLELASTIARHLAVVHRETHRTKIGTEALTEMNKTFENSNMLSLTKEFIFTRPFNKADETNRCSDSVRERLDTVYRDQQVLQTANKMLKIFLEKKECLVHGDLHTGSILVNGSDARIFDMEFAYVGPAAFDLGLLIANYIFSYHRHISIPENNEERRQFAYLMIEACKITVTAYLSVMTAPVGDRESYEANLLSETAGFAGCEIVRRLVGAAHNEDLEGMGFAEQDCLGAGVRLLQATDRIHSIDRLMVIALMLAY